MSRVTVRGHRTTVELTEVQVEEQDLIRQAIKLMDINDIKSALILHVTKQMKDADPTLSEYAEIDWGQQKWIKFSYRDHHKGDDIYTTIRKFNTQELDMQLSVEALISVLK